MRVLAVVTDQMRAELLRQLAPLEMTVVCAGRALEVASILSRESAFQVVILPASLPDGESWALWGEICLIDPRPEVLVYSRSATFQLWTGVLDTGGFDVIVHPFSDLEIQNAVLRAVRSFKERRAGKRSAK
jgi:DNA-binding NtrC family response regulator